MHFLKSLVFTIFSPKFYGEAVAKGGKKALKNFTLFALVVSFVSFAYFAVTFGFKLIDLPNSLDEIPDISVTNGILTTDPAQPYILSETDSYLAVDTTGEITEIPEGYISGVLFTETDLIIRSEDTVQLEGEVQSISYTELFAEMEIDSFELEKDSISNFLRTGGIAIIVLSPIFIFLGKWIGGLISVLFISVLGFILLSASGVTDSFKKSYIIGLYAIIPVTYIGLLGWLLSKGMALLGIDFTLGSLCCLIPILLSLIKWGIFWGIGAYGVINLKKQGSSPKPVEKVEEVSQDKPKEATSEEKES